MSKLGFQQLGTIQEKSKFLPLWGNTGIYCIVVRKYLRIQKMHSPLAPPLFYLILFSFYLTVFSGFGYLVRIPADSAHSNILLDVRPFYTSWYTGIPTGIGGKKTLVNSHYSLPHSTAWGLNSILTSTLSIYWKTRKVGYIQYIQINRRHCRAFSATYLNQLFRM